MSTVKRSPLLLVLVAAHSALALGAGTSTPHSRGEEDRTWRMQAAQRLIARADANSLATAAALRFEGRSANAKPDPSALDLPSAPDLAARASELAPQNAGIGWLRLRLCAETPACDIRDAATTMRWVDADNGAVWMPTLAAAQDKDSTEIDRVLADMAQGTRFDLYWNRITLLMFDSLEKAPDKIPGRYAASYATRLATVSGIASGEIIPPFAPLVEACRDSAAVPERRESCLKLSKIMQRGDTIVAQMAGFGIEKRLLAPDSKEARAVGERKNLLLWRMTAAAKFDMPLLPWLKNARARARLAQMRANPREEDVCIAILREHRVANQPANQQ